MSKLKRPASISEGSPIYRIWVDIKERGVSFKFHRGSGIHIGRMNPSYYESIGRWFCNEVEAMSLEDNPYTPPRNES